MYQARHKDVVNRISNVCQVVGCPKPRIIAVTKFKSVAEISAFQTEVPLRDFGENYVHEICDKASQLSKDIRWHFIGNLQSNKIKALASVANLVAVHSVTSSSQASKLSVAREGMSPLEVFIQVNPAQEQTKGGVPIEDLEPLVAAVRTCANLRLSGLMAIVRPGISAKVDFRAVAAAGAQFGLSEYSMGMTSDFEDALAEGSTLLRIGSALLGHRS